MNVCICSGVTLIGTAFRVSLADIFAEAGTETQKILVDAIPVGAAVLGFNWTVARGACYALSIQKK